MIYRNYLGLDLQSRTMRAVSLRRMGKSGVGLTGGRMLGLEDGILLPSFRSPNILDISRFIDSLHELLDPLAKREERISLALPEQSGVLFMAEIESILKSKKEGVEILKWQFRDKLPPDIDVQLDYQVVDRDETGRQKLLVAGMAMDVLKQYEEVLSEAGYGAEVIGFRSMALFNFYRSRFDVGENVALIQVEDDTLNFQYYQNRVLMFYRSRFIDDDVENIYRELSRTLAGEKERFSGMHKASVYLHSNWQKRDQLLPIIDSLFAREPILLDPSVEKMSQEVLSLPDPQARSLATAVGAAERLM